MFKSKKKAQVGPKGRRTEQESMLHKSLPNHLANDSTRGSRSNSTLVADAAKKQRRKKRIKKILVGLLIVLLIAGGWVGWKFLSNSAKIFGWKDLLGGLQEAKLKGEDEGRVNVLLAGNSADDPGHGGAELTDSIMVLSINPEDKTAFIISIPRDLYVDIPGHDYAKINEVYQDGEQDNFSEAGYADGGMGLLEKVVSQKFGIPIHYYALVNYAALEQAVNAVGGITINVQSSDPDGLYDPSRDLETGEPLVDLPNGEQTLNGRQALNLARARGNGYGSYGFPRSDFNRAEHQRQILIGLKDKVGSASTLSNPVKVGQLFDSMGNNVKTDFSLAEVRRLYTLIKEIPSADITSASLSDGKDVDLLESYRTRLGQSALIPAAGIDDYSEIQTYIQELLNKPSTTAPKTNGSSQ